MHGYNSLLLVPVLITLKKYVKSKKQIKMVAIISNVVIVSFGIIIFFILSNIGTEISSIEMPVAYATLKTNKFIQWGYGAIILLAIFTTSISLGNSFLSNIKLKRNVAQILICLGAIVCSNIGFSNLISNVYPIFGIIGAIQIIQLKLNN